VDTIIAYRINGGPVNVVMNDDGTVESWRLEPYPEDVPVKRKTRGG